MKDRQATRRPLTIGVPAAPKGGIPMDDGILMDDGVERGPQSVYGIPAGPIIRSSDLETGHCKATTKAGNPCKAYAKSDSKFCVGHDK